MTNGILIPRKLDEQILPYCYEIHWHFMNQIFILCAGKLPSFCAPEKEDDEVLSNKINIVSAEFF